MQIKQFDKQGIIAWSNSKVHSELLASAATSDDNGFYSLDILSLDLQQRSKKINVIGSGYTDQPFRCVAWDNFGEKDNSFSHGLIFTGQDNSTFKLWDPAEMIATYSSRAPSVEGIAEQTCIVYDEELELETSYPIMCAEWNALSNHMLAFGTTDVYILLVDKNPEEPDIRKPGKKNPHNGSYVTSVSWNREVPHILASASENGLVALWDIKTNNSIFQFRDSGTSPSGERNVEICWSKNISTQIAVTLDDEKHNQLQIWDLRNQKGPVVVIDKCHSKGINAMDWCETDPELILTTSRDKKLVCWNYTQQEEPLSETNLDCNAFSVKWSKKLPSIYSVCTEQKTLIYSLNDANLFSYVPKWYKVPVGASLLGNESIITYSEQRGNVLHETKLIDHNKHSTLRPKLKALAEIVEKRFDEESDSELANLIKAKSGENDTEIFDYLGFSKSKIVQEVEKYTGKKREFAAGSQKEKSTKHKPKAYTQIQGQDAFAFFANINTQSFQQNANHEEDQNNDRVQYDMVPRNFNWDLGKERLVKQNILIGNYEGAIDAALKCGRTAEALIIAYSCGQNLFSNTLKTFFTETTDSFITDVLKHIAYKDAFELVKRYDLNKWKECIALILSFASSDRRPELLKLLANRLRNESQQADIENDCEVIPESYAAIICCVLAEDFNQICDIYYENLRSFASGSKERKEAVIEYARRLVLIYQHLTTEVADLKIFQKIIREVSFIAIEEHEKVLAHQLLTGYASNSQKTLDYLINSTKELNKYKTAIKYKTTVLPIMQIKKQEKKGAAKPNEQAKQPQKPKVKIFEKEEQVKPPPAPPGPKRKVQESNEGFSPFNTQKPQEPPVVAQKKNLNTPPPMPMPIKKAPVAVSHPEEEQEPRKVEPPKAVVKQPPPVTKKMPPPPPPPANTSYHEQKEEIPQNRSVVIEKPAVKSPPPPPPPSEKKIPPPAVKPVQKQQVERYEAEQDQQPRAKIPPPSKPVPARHQQVEQTNESNFPKKQLPRPPPPKQEEAPKSKANLPPPKFQQKREEEKEVVSEPIRKTVPPPPPVKKTVPPPPMRK